MRRCCGLLPCIGVFIRHTLPDAIPTLLPNLMNPMNIIRALLIILGCLAVGETAVLLLDIKLPGSIIGMGVLFVALKSGRIKLEWIKPLADALMANLTLFLVPPCVAIISYLDVLAADWFSILTATVLSTLCVLVVTGKVHEWVRRLMS